MYNIRCTYFCFFTAGSLMSLCSSFSWLCWACLAFWFGINFYKIWINIHVSMHSFLFFFFTYSVPVSKSSILIGNQYLFILHFFCWNLLYVKNNVIDTPRPYTRTICKTTFQVSFWIFRGTCHPTARVKIHLRDKNLSFNSEKYFLLLYRFYHKLLNTYFTHYTCIKTSTFTTPTH